jgi:peroxiredoxin family protein
MCSFFTVWGLHIFKNHKKQKRKDTKDFILGDKTSDYRSMVGKDNLFRR